MTTILIDTVNKKAYADSRATVGDEGAVYSERVKKIFHHKGNIYIGAGNLLDIINFSRGEGNYILEENTCVYTINKAIGLVQLHKGVRQGVLRKVIKGFRKNNTVTCCNDCRLWASGSGGVFAALRVLAGMEPEDAIRSASLLDPYSNDAIQQISW